MADSVKVVVPPVYTEPTKEFRLRPNRAHNHGGVDVQPGDVLHLNARQAVAFRDKFEAVDENAPFVDHGAEVHKKFFANAANRAAKDAGIGPVAQGDEAAQAQKDKLSAETKVGSSSPEAVSTFDAAAGTLTKDPGPTTKK